MLGSAGFEAVADVGSAPDGPPNETVKFRYLGDIGVPVAS
jgi:hypothetical protein